MDAALHSSHPVRRSFSRDGAFSLVEVTLALGIVACALLPLVGLLSVGVNSYQNANARGPGAQAISQIASCIRSATATFTTTGTTTVTTYKAAPPFDAITWLADGTTSTKSYSYFFYDSGQIATTPTTGKPAQMAAMVVIKAPNRGGTNFAAGTAQIAVAWPGLGTPNYTPGTPADAIGTITFVNPQGHEETTISFVPN